MKAQDCVHLQSNFWAVACATVTGDFWNGAVRIYSSNAGNLKVESEWVYEPGGLTSLTRIALSDTTFAILCGTMSGEVLSFTVGKDGSFELNKPQVYLFHSSPVMCIASQDNLVLTGGADNRVNLLSAAEDSIKVGSTIIAHHKTVHALSWIDNTSFLSAGADGDIKVWKLGEPLKIAPRPLHVFSLASALASLSNAAPSLTSLAPSQPYALANWSLGKYLAVGTDDGLVVYVEPLSEKPTILRAVNSMAPIKSLAFRPRLDRIVLVAGTDDGKIRTFEVTTDKGYALVEIKNSFPQRTDFVRALAWSGLGNSLLSIAWGEVVGKDETNGSQNTEDDFDENFEFEEEALDLTVHENLDF